MKLNKLKKIVCDQYMISNAQLCSKLREAKYVEARQVYSYLAYNILGKSYYEIGESINRTHATIIWGTNKVQDYLDVNDKQITTSVNTAKGKVFDIESRIEVLKQRIEKTERLMDELISKLCDTEDVEGSHELIRDMRNELLTAHAELQKLED